MYVMYLVSLSYAQVNDVGNGAVYKRNSNIVYDIKILLLVGLSHNSFIFEQITLSTNMLKKSNN